jgi:VanZ family protein
MIRRPFRPAFFWLVVVLVLGSAYFGPKQTQHHVVPALHAVVPWMSPGGTNVAHAVLRKLSHLTEYAVLAFLWARAFRSAGRLGLMAALGAALAVCVACATVDEIHQTQAPGRHGSVTDVALDSLGALAMLLVVRARASAPRGSSTADGYIAAPGPRPPRPGRMSERRPA